MASKQIRIVLVDDHELFRIGLRVLLSTDPDLLVVGEAAEGQSAIRLALELAPDVIIMDVHMAGIGGIEATRQIMAHEHPPKVLGLSSADELSAMEMARAGASGFVKKTSAATEIVQAVHEMVSTAA